MRAVLFREPDRKCNNRDHGLAEEPCVRNRALAWTRGNEVNINRGRASPAISLIFFQSAGCERRERHLDVLHLRPHDVTRVNEGQAGSLSGNAAAF